MDCPDCKTVLVRKRGHEILLDTCPKCRGIWFDTNELGEFLKAEVATNPNIPNAQIHLSTRTDRGFAPAPQAGACPSCSEALQSINFAYDSNVFVRRCLACGGTWTTREQLRQLAVFTKGNPKLDRLANSTAGEMADTARMQGMADAVDDFTRGNRYYWFGPRIILPLGDDIGRTTSPLVTIGLIVANIAVFIAAMTLADDYQALVGRFGLVPVRIMAGNAVLTVVTSMFLHRDVFHLLGNMFFLWIFGDNVEEAFGRPIYVFVYFLSGIGAALCQIAVDPHSTLPMIGASGAIAGVMGAYFVFYPKAGIRTFVYSQVVTIPAPLYIAAWFAFQLLYGTLAQSSEASGGVAYFAHVGGLVCGVVLALTYKAVVGQKVPQP